MAMLILFKGIQNRNECFCYFEWSMISHVSLRRLGKLCIGYASHFISLDSSGNRILDIGDASLDVCIDVRAILKGAVAFLIEGAVFEGAHGPYSRVAVRR